MKYEMMFFVWFHIHIFVFFNFNFALIVPYIFSPMVGLMDKRSNGYYIMNLYVTRSEDNKGMFFQICRMHILYEICSILII